ncbi:helix-hairpin-helix domain-containing protein [Halosimplex pelagicum]|uniref:Helix-hairpin-helix domain-containing protein n=1 Tax=Halosimplex pelagicum TaxID=869886 RepID=A0A7D5P8I4_9EURY|nr:helix-hairpin-helix domain-containing protein [Halosimplex pelagicum]QLH83446.1 helix-hairpin-helix domain-containing protein [Halosimplex pelagicum]
MADQIRDPSRTNRIDTAIGLVLEDQRTAERRQVIYTDARVVLLRDESGGTTLVRRDSFDAELGTRYRPRPGAEAPSDAGQYDRLREHLAAYERDEGRKAKHKADALREALDLLAEPNSGDAGGTSGDSDGGDADDGDAGGSATHADPEVPFEEVPGIGPKTAGKLRTAGYVTESDVRGAADDALLAVAGLGPESLSNLREFVG